MLEGRHLLADAKSTPSLTLGSLETLEQVEERDWGERVDFRGAAWETVDDSFDGPFWLCCSFGAVCRSRGAIVAC